MFIKVDDDKVIFGEYFWVLFRLCSVDDVLMGFFGSNLEVDTPPVDNSMTVLFLKFGIPGGVEYFLFF